MLMLGYLYHQTNSHLAYSESQKQRDYFLVVFSDKQDE